MQHIKKIEILEKISKAITLYAEIKRIKKYLIIKHLRYDAEYKAIFLSDEKLFQHSAEFKANKKQLFDRGGNKNKEYYTNIREWLLDNHFHYTEFKSAAFKLINNNSAFSEQDLQRMNTLYKDIKELKNARAKKK